MMVHCAECLKIQDGDYVEHEEVKGTLVCEYCLAEMELAPKIQTRKTFVRRNEPYGYMGGRCVECERTDGGHDRWCLAVD